MAKAELWKDVKGYEGLYQISDLGRVKALAKRRNSGSGFYIQKERIMAQQLKDKRYYGICLLKDGKYKNFLVHRLVAEAFLDNPNGYDQVNHKDCNKLNNEVRNLEWCNQEMNLQHALEHGLLTKWKKDEIDNR